MPGGRRLEAEALAGALAHVVEAAGTDGARLVLLPPRERGAAFWRAAHGGRFGVPSEGWDLIEDASGGQAPGPAAVLVVPELAALTDRRRRSPAAATPPAGGPPTRGGPVGRPTPGGAAAWRSPATWPAAGPRWRSSMPAGGACCATKPTGARMGRPHLRPSPGPESARPRLAAAGRARCLDLPETAGDARRRLAPALVAEVAGWVAGRGAEARDPEAPAAWPAVGVHLAVGPPAAARRGLLAALGGAWERGRLEAWALLVSHEPWPEAAGLAAEAGVAGCSAWPAEGRAPAPVLWVRPGDLADERLIAYLAIHRPVGGRGAGPAGVAARTRARRPGRGRRLAGPAGARYPGGAAADRDAAGGLAGIPGRGDRRGRQRRPRPVRRRAVRPGARRRRCWWPVCASCWGSCGRCSSTAARQRRRRPAAEGAGGPTGAGGPLASPGRPDAGAGARRIAPAALGGPPGW